MAEVDIIRYLQHPGGVPDASCFALERAAAPEPADCEVLVRPVYLSMDPYLRIRMRAEPTFEGGPIMGGPLAPGSVVPSRGSGIVLASRHPDFAEGDRVAGQLAWATEVAAPAEALVRLPPAPGVLRLSQSLLGGVGMTAYFALLDKGQPRAGETVLIASAAGGVGVVAVQLAKLRGARVVGIAGGPEKCVFLRDELGCDATVDHRGDDPAAALDAACPEGIDIFLDSIGGPLHDAAMAHMNERGRIVVLGAIGRYGDDAEDDLAPRNLYRIAIRRLRIEGFVLGDHIPRFPQAQAEMLSWLEAGQIRPIDTIHEGLAAAPAAFATLFGGAPPGKVLVRVAPDPDVAG
jgi:hypothetical protein